MCQAHEHVLNWWLLLEINVKILLHTWLNTVIKHPESFVMIGQFLIYCLICVCATPVMFQVPLWTHPANFIMIRATVVELYLCMC